MLYNMTIDGDTMHVGFGDPASNDDILREIVQTLGTLDLSGGPLLRITGPASLPVAVAIAHKVTHLYGAIAVYDPKLQAYVVAVSHSPNYTVGDLIA